jgi:hypothetical protein
MTIPSKNSGVHNLPTNPQPVVPPVQNTVLTPEPLSIEERILWDIMSCDVTRELWQRAIASPNPYKLDHIPERQGFNSSEEELHVSSTQPLLPSKRRPRKRFKTPPEV